MTIAQPSTDISLELREVSCVLGGKPILDRVSLALRKREIVAILGASGAGKSTLLRTIAGFEPVSHGEIRRGDQVLSSAQKMVPPEDRHVGIVVQSFALFPHLTAKQNVMFALADSDRSEVADSWLASVGLEKRGGAYPHELSGGEQQRVALARAMVRDPDIVLLDEAFSSLDQQMRQAVRGETKRLLRASGAAVLAVTHDPDEAMDLADRVIVLDQGRIIQQGNADEVFWNPASATAARLLGEVNELRGKVRAGRLCTSFADIPAEQLEEGASAYAVVRPAAVKFNANKGGSLTVTEVQLSGGQYRVLVKAASGEELRLLHNDGNPPAPGTRGELEFMSGCYSVVPA